MARRLGSPGSPQGPVDHLASSAGRGGEVIFTARPAAFRLGLEYLEVNVEGEALCPDRRKYIKCFIKFDFGLMSPQSHKKAKQREKKLQ